MKEKLFTLLALSFLLFSGNARAAFEAERFFSCEAMKVPLHIVFKRPTDSWFMMFLQKKNSSGK